MQRLRRQSVYSTVTAWEARGRVVRRRAVGDATITEVEYPADTVLRDHRHDRSYVSIALEGRYTEVRDAVPAACAPGTIILHARDEEHADYFRSPGRCINVELPDDWVPASGGIATGRAANPAAAMREIVRCLYGGRPSDEGSAFRTALAVLLAQRDVARASELPESLATVLRQFGWTDARPLADAARIAGLHPTHFARVFRRHLGMTPVAYRNAKRVEAGSRMLLKTETSLAAVAHEIGFHDQSHFSNVFGRACGMSPGRYRSIFAR